ncbi:DnaJ domain-containing protein [Halomicrobium zhouii]|uniref:DnaJ domain-containing protein n=1 Tax=Halomicrobium zhouii TaxID=767519 RepID=A0A1I6KRT9_9EURY|nr:J domain-containing protein [Halomicrobium zhouii]SFR93748.1 DnaJ domain-containing protein [Halomicrobium zhouii]
MQYDRLVTGLAGVLGGITVVMTVLGLLFEPPILFVALTFGAATYLVYFHTSGRMAARVYQTVERQAAVDPSRGRRRQRTGRRGRRDAGAGPREDWTPPRDGRTAREAAAAGAGGREGATHSGRSGQRQASQRGQGRRQQRRGTRQRQRPPNANSGPTAAEAYRTLGLDPGADESSVKQAYREKVKQVHPDTDGGDEEAFKAVTAAYERLTD